MIYTMLVKVQPKKANRMQFVDLTAPGPSEGRRLETSYLCKRLEPCLTPLWS